MTNQKFTSCCGPGEWVVCNCLSERDDYLPYIPTPEELETVEPEELTGHSTNE